MAPKKARRTKPEPAVELVVRRGSLKRFQKLKDATVDLPVDIVWDRREQERRAEQAGVENERRRTDRRRKPQFTWDTADFVVADKSRR